MGNLPKTCDICFKTMRGDTLKRHMLKHEKTWEWKNVKKEVLTYEQNCEMIRKNMEIDIAKKQAKN